jgi:hypothetical protein
MGDEFLGMEDQASRFATMILFVRFIHVMFKWIPICLCAVICALDAISLCPLHYFDRF